MDLGEVKGLEVGSGKRPLMRSSAIESFESKSNIQSKSKDPPSRSSCLLDNLIVTICVFAFTGIF